MKYEDLIKISDPYKVYINFKDIYPCDSHIGISTRKNKKDFTILLYLIISLSAFPVENNLEEISKLKSKQNTKVPIYKQILRLKEFINKHAENMFRQKF